MAGLLIFLHFTLVTAIICIVLVQRSAESSILVDSNHFSPGGVNKFLVKITRVLVAIFIINCLLISYLKYGKTFSKIDSNEVRTQRNNTVPTE